MTQENLELQLDWDVSHLHGKWRRDPDNFFIMSRLAAVPTEATVAGGPGRVLEVAAAEAIHACKISLRGMETYVVEPSPVMLERAQGRIAEYGARVHLVRGIAETLPFPDATFDRVLIDSAIDHLANPERSLAEMTRVLKPDGRMVVSFVNYDSLSVRLSRLLYRAGRALGVTSRDEHLFWDTPVPIEHSFECTLPLLRRLCAPYLELDRAFGVSIGWMTPGWGPLLARLPPPRAAALLQRLDRFAYRTPRIADVVVSIWRPHAAGAARVAAPAADGARVRADDVVYPGRARAEADYWAQADFGGRLFQRMQAGQRDANAAYTGDPERSWLDDLRGRGPFRDAAMLGCDEGGYERQWLDAGGSDRLDIYELSPGVIRKVRAGLGLGRYGSTRGGREVHFIQTDLNFARLPAARYDVIWSSSCLHHIANLEHLLAEVERALRPGGLFALHDYVGERRLQYAPERLALINALLREIPVRFRAGGMEAITAPRPEGLSPFCGVRSDDILPLARARFDVVHEAVAGALFPLPLVLDLPALAREEPALLARLTAAEQEALRDPTMRGCGAYAVFRKR